MNSNTIGLDIAKSVFQVHGVEARTGTVFKKRLRRPQVKEYFAGLEPSLIGIEACGGAHHWARELCKLGHEVKLLPPAYVKPYVKRGKSDALDAEAICEALVRPTMRFVPIRSVESQAVLVLHKVRDQLVKQRTTLINVLRGHMAEFGIVAPKGVWRTGELKAIVADQADWRLPDLARRALERVVHQLDVLEADIDKLERLIVKQCKTSEASKRLAAIPGVGPIAATALAASVEDASRFKSGRHFAAWLGLTPKRNASGLRERKGRISKMGNTYLRTLLVLGATAIVGHAKRSKAPSPGLATRLLSKGKPVRLITVALANKMARIVWAMLAKGEAYRSLPAHQGDAHPLLAASLASMG
jgi:transposase